MMLRETSSKLLLTEPLMANFAENSANGSGGAIYFDDSLSVRQLCFDTTFRNCSIELTSRTNIRLNFNNNIANIAGRIFHGGSLDRCNLIVGGKFSNDNPLNTIASISNINVNVSNLKDNTTSNVSSSQLKVCICKDDSLIR